ncbi:MAG: hypothetical protein GY945_11760 [Rhodobacteraceae bacterium]|nr:hypothetical protein [Paracoccaceae bacterium]
MSGKTSYLAGLSAEEIVARDYQARGNQIAAKRWRGTRGEIDLVARDDDGLVFIEVKKARDFARAAERLSQAQMKRIYAAASEFLASEPMGQNTPVRFDVALVNASGQMQVIENAFGL